MLGQTLCLGEQWCTIVDEPEVYEDRDPAQREAEGPKSSMDYLKVTIIYFCVFCDLEKSAKFKDR